MMDGRFEGSAIFEISKASSVNQNTNGRSQNPKLTAVDIKALPESDLLLHFPSHDQLPHNIKPRVFSNYEGRPIQQDIVAYHLKTPHIKVPNAKLPFCEQKDFPRAFQVMYKSFDPSQISTCFPNLETAEKYIRNSARRSSRDDPAIPTDPEMQRVLVAILKHAFQSTAIAKDRSDYVETFKTACNDPRIVEYHCWKLFYAIIDRAKSGVPVAGTYGSMTQSSKHHYDSFCDLFDAVRYALQVKKTLCNQILDCPDVVKLADDPLARVNKSIENQTVNNQKRKDINVGRRARVEAGEAAPPKKRVRMRRYTDDSEEPNSRIVEDIPKYDKETVTDYFSFKKDSGQTFPTSQSAISLNPRSQLGSVPHTDQVPIPMPLPTPDHQARRDRDLINTGAGLQLNSNSAGDEVWPLSLFAEPTAGPPPAAPANNNDYNFANLDAYDDLFQDFNNNGLRGEQKGAAQSSSLSRLRPDQDTRLGESSIWHSGRRNPRTSSYLQHGYQAFDLGNEDGIQDSDKYLS